MKSSTDPITAVSYPNRKPPMHASVARYQYRPVIDDESSPSRTLPSGSLPVCFVCAMTASRESSCRFTFPVPGLCKRLAEFGLNRSELRPRQESGSVAYDGGQH